jgi:hypothetical protein
VSGLPPDLKGRVLRAARSTPAATRSGARTLSWLVLPSSVIVAGSLYFTFGGPEHGAGRASWFYVASTLGWAAVAAMSTWSVLARGRSATGRPTSALWAIAAGTPAALFALMFALVLIEPTATLLHPELLGYRCFGLTVAAAAFPLLALVLVRRGTDAVHPVANGAALGAACGAAAGVMVEMWCPVATPAHVAFGHVAPIVLLTALGAALGVRVLAIRAKPRAPA